MLVTSDRGGGEAPWVPLTTWWRSSKPYSFQRLGLVTTLTHNILYALFLLSKYCKLPHSSVPSYLMSFQSRLGRSFLNFASFDRIKSAHIWSGTPASAQVDVPDLAPDPSVCPKDFGLSRPNRPNRSTYPDRFLLRSCCQYGVNAGLILKWLCMWDEIQWVKFTIVEYQSWKLYFEISWFVMNLANNLLAPFSNSWFSKIGQMRIQIPDPLIRPILDWNRPLVILI